MKRKKMFDEYRKKNLES